MTVQTELYYMKFLKLKIKARFASVMICLGLMTSGHVVARHFVDDSLRVDGHVRKFAVYLPSGLRKDAPLVFVLHGYGGGIDKANPMKHTADNHGFALCIPEGLCDPQNKRSWNVGYPFQKTWKQNDVKDLQRMAAYVQQKYSLSKVNTFCTGMSNGGEMCYLLAYSNQTTFKAVASIAGLTMLWMYKNLEAPRPIPLFEVHGTQDHVSEWWGNLKEDGSWGKYMPVPQAVNYWVAKDRCTYESKDTISSINSDKGHQIIRHKYLNGKDGCEVWLYEVVGAPHCWHTDDLDTGEEVWNFFRRYVK